MQVKTFEAVDMKQAMKLVKSDMGPAAVIVSSRSVRKDSGLFGLLGRKVLEVTAAVEETPSHAPLDVSASLAPDVGGGTRKAPTPARASRSKQSGVYHDLWAVKQAVDPVLDEVRSLRDSMRHIEDDSGPSATDIRSDLSQIRTLLSSIIGSQAFAGDKQGAAAQRVFYYLISRGVDDPLARSLVQRVVARVDSGSLGDLDRLKLNLAAEMRADLSRVERGSAPSRVQMFVGPTGVGKTTTIAKLAARAERNSPGGALIVTTDVQRVAAVEQMIRYGEMLSIPVEVALTPQDLARTIAHAGDREQILIDTAGRSPRDASAFAPLNAMIEAAGENEVLLVSAATTRAIDSRELLDAYARVPWSRLIMTKLDETRVYGELYNCMVRSGRPIACVTTGQAVPEHLESLDVPGILRKVLHG